MPSIDLTSTHSLLIQLAQDKRAAVVANAQTLVQQANKMIQEGESVLRSAVERVLLESLEELPKANVAIKNGDDGAPASLVWEEPQEADVSGGADAGGEADEAADEAGAEAEEAQAEPAPRKAPVNVAAKPLARPQARKPVGK